MLNRSGEESGVAEGRSFSAWVDGTAAPSADGGVSVHFWSRCNRALSREGGADMSMPRRLGGFYPITGPDINGPNSLVTFSTYCDEFSSAS